MKKIKKTKTGLIATLGFAAVALLSVGFSAWVVSEQTTASVGNVTVSVADVTNKNVALAVTNSTNNSFRFDAEAGDVKGPITAGDGSNCDLTIGFTFTATFETDQEDSFQGIYVASKAASGEGINSANTIGGANYKLDTILANANDYINFPMELDGTLDGTDYTDSLQIVGADQQGVNGSGLTVDVTSTTDGDNTVLNVTVTLAFSWGTYFNRQNPSVYAGTSEARETAEIITALGTLQTCNNNVFALDIYHPAA